MDVSENSGTPKSSILIGFSTINHPFWGTPNFWKHPNLPVNSLFKGRHVALSRHPTGGASKTSDRRSSRHRIVAVSKDSWKNHGYGDGVVVPRCGLLILLWWWWWLLLVVIGWLVCWFFVRLVGWWEKFG